VAGTRLEQVVGAKHLALGHGDQDGPLRRQIKSPHRERKPGALGGAAMTAFRADREVGYRPLE
jgi:hypothetical protein